MPKAKDPFADLEIDEDILDSDTSKSEPAFFNQTEDSEPEVDSILQRQLTNPTKEDLKQMARAMPPKHMRGKSLKREEEYWQERIVPSAQNVVYLRAGTEDQAKILRTRFYNARSYLMWVQEKVIDAFEKHPTSTWSISIKEYKRGWYLKFINIALDDLILEEPEAKE